MISNFSKILLSVTCFFGMNTAFNQAAGCQNGLSNLNRYASLALGNAKQIYCDNVPRLFNTSCDQFLVMLSNETTVRLPQLILPQKIDTNNEQNELFIISATINEYLNLVTWGINEECKMLYKPATDFECVFENLCENNNGDEAIFYCRLYVVHQFLENFNVCLKSIITSTMAPPMVEHPRLSPELKNSLYIRWHLTKILDAGLKQMSAFEKVMKR